MKLAVLGSGGLLGAAIVRAASAAGLQAAAARSREVDARSEKAVGDWLQREAPDALVIVAARNAGVHANITAPADMLQENAAIALASIGAARAARTPRILYCASSALYPADAPQPYRETSAGAGPVEPSHLGYSAAKLLGVHFCQAARINDGLDCTALLLTNLYGPGASFDPARSNVVPAMLLRMHEAAQSGAAHATVWGSGRASRDLLYVEDAAAAVILAAQRPGPADGLMNVASGIDIPIRRLAETCASLAGFSGEIVFDASRPEGVPSRSVDISRLAALGWSPKVGLREGLDRTYRAFLDGRAAG